MSKRWSAFALVSSLAAFAQIASAVPITLAAAGPDAADIQGAVDAFRAAIGEPNNGNDPGPLPGGRREINWDGGGSLDTSVAGTPFTGFQNTRGATFATPATQPGTGFVQAPPDGLATQFGIPSYATTFAAFSAARLFSPIDSNVTDVTFSIPGSAGAIPASVSAFGAVFSDVDSQSTTTLQFFTEGDVPLGEPFPVPAAPGDATFSFLGVLFEGEKITRVRITTGNAAPGVADMPGVSDVVMMDDFIFSEPVPEPGTLALLALGLAGLGLMGRARLPE
jgi:hypothetical protein